MTGRYGTTLPTKYFSLRAKPISFSWRWYQLAYPLHPANIAMDCLKNMNYHELTTFHVTLPISSSFSRLCSCDVVLDGPCFAWLGMFSINRPSSCRAEGCNASNSALGHFGGPQHRPTRIVSLDVTDRLESLSSHQQRRCNIIFRRFSEGQNNEKFNVVEWIIVSSLYSLLGDSKYIKI
eukprot:s675_g14.t1